MNFHRENLILDWTVGQRVSSQLTWENSLTHLAGDEIVLYMIQVFSNMNFNNPNRAQYLERSFGSFYKFNSDLDIEHIALDSSQSLDAQKKYYDQFGIHYIHCPDETYARRLRKIADLATQDYFLFLPEDFRWIFKFPIEEAIGQAKEHNVEILKLTCRGMNWFSQKNPTNPKGWFQGDQVISGERLKKKGDLFVSDKMWLRDFHEQFSLSCVLFQTEFAKKVFNKISEKCISPGQCEKSAYLRLIFTRYSVGYYKMMIPAFHFLDFSVEGKNKYTEVRAADELIEDNIETYNKLFNQV